MQLRMKVCSFSKLSVPCIFGQPRSIVPVTTLYVRVSHDNSVLYPVTALNVQLCKCACVPLQLHNVVPVTTLYLYVCHVTTPYYSIVPVTTLQMYLCLMTIPYYCLRDNPVKLYP